MSGGYAARLTKGVDYGKCGAPESEDNDRVMSLRIGKLIKIIKNSNYIVAHTGAGISTSAGIPDFRGPNGIWTKELRGEKSDEKETSWDDARPTYCHRALAALYQMGKLKFIVSQNVDGLHLRSGIPPSHLSELHGNVFLEKCPTCNTGYYRPFDVKGIGFKPTGRQCDRADCNGSALNDELLDWNDALPEEALRVAEYHCQQADLALCLGTSLRVNPACELPLKTMRNEKGGTMVIVNLQKTDKDCYASLRVFGRCDEVMARVMEGLQVVVPAYDLAADFVVGRRSIVVGPEDTPKIPSPEEQAEAKRRDKKRRPKFPAYSRNSYYIDPEGLKVSDDESESKSEEMKIEEVRVIEFPPESEILKEVSSITILKQEEATSPAKKRRLSENNHCAQGDFELDSERKEEEAEDCYFVGRSTGSGRKIPIYRDESDFILIHSHEDTNDDDSLLEDGDQHAKRKTKAKKEPTPRKKKAQRTGKKRVQPIRVAKVSPYDIETLHFNKQERPASPVKRNREVVIRSPVIDLDFIAPQNNEILNASPATNYKRNPNNGLQHRSFLNDLQAYSLNSSNNTSTGTTSNTNANPLGHPRVYVNSNNSPGNMSLNRSNYVNPYLTRARKNSNSNSENSSNFSSNGQLWTK